VNRFPVGGKPAAVDLGITTREALAPEPRLACDMDVPVFAVREDAAPITPEMVEAAGEEG
jgi:hypothetical protein